MEMKDESVSLYKAQAAIAKRAATDGEFRARLVADPRAAIAEAFGMEVPASATIQVVEAAPGTIVVQVPAQASADADLSDAQLASVAGGGDCFLTSKGTQTDCFDANGCYCLS